jgi:hypothetical protein
MEQLENGSHPIGTFRSDFTDKNLYELLISPMRATFPAHFILRDMIILIIFFEEYKDKDE